MNTTLNTFIASMKQIGLNVLTFVVCAVVLFYTFKISLVLFKLVAVIAAVSVGLLAASALAQAMNREASGVAAKVVSEVENFWKNRF